MPNYRNDYLDWSFRWLSLWFERTRFEEGDDWGKERGEHMTDALAIFAASMIEQEGGDLDAFWSKLESGHSAAKVPSADR